MIESFAQLFEESQNELETRQGAIIDADVVDIQKQFVIVDTGLKSEASIPVKEFFNANGELTVKVGDSVKVYLDSVEDGYGETKVSREKAIRYEAWLNLEKAYEEQSVVTGIISNKVKGGFTVELNGVRAFLPGSLVDVRPVRDTSDIEGKELEFKVIKLDQARNNIVVSRKAILKTEDSKERTEILDSLEEGQVVKGIVKNLADYGAFIDLNGVDGLLHITDIAWKRVKHPSEIINPGEEIEVKILKIDREKIRVSLGLKQLIEDPWVSVIQKYQSGDKIHGKVTNITDYGCFVEIADGVEGLVHVSEMDWTNRNIHPSKVVSLGDEIDVKLLEVDTERRRISLGLKQCKVNPWEHFNETHNKNDVVEGEIKSITDFGLFIGLDGGIDGLIHLSDISWNMSGEEAIKGYKKGDKVQAIVLQIDPVKERISLGIKQLTEDPFNDFANDTKKGDVLKGTVKEVNAKGVVVTLDNGIEGFIKTFNVSKEFMKDNEVTLQVGETVEVKVVNVDRKTHSVALSTDTAAKTSSFAPRNDRKDDVKMPNAMSEAFKKANK